MNVRMTDDPGTFDQVNLVITQVSARVEDFDPDTTDVDTTDADGEDDDGGGWIVLENDAATFDLMTLQNGQFATIGSALVPAGHYTEIRLKLGAGSNVGRRRRHAFAGRSERHAIGTQAQGQLRRADAAGVRHRARLRRGALDLPDRHGPVHAEARDQDSRGAGGGAGSRDTFSRPAPLRRSTQRSCRTRPAARARLPMDTSCSPSSARAATT
jgi:hypothetical protein